MKTSARRYQVGGLPFTVALESPYEFMEYTEPVLRRIRCAAAGQVLPTLPTRAGDDVPARTFVTCREDLPADYGCGMLDFSQYEPFRTGEGADDIFRMTLRSSGFEDVSAVTSDPSAKLIRRIREDYPYLDIYRRAGRDIYLFSTDKGEVMSVLDISVSGEDAAFISAPGTAVRRMMLHFNTAMMIQYTYVSSSRSALMIHSSVIKHDGMADMFLGDSGTGKSTHSRLWLENIPGAELVNDDNPVLRMEDGVLYVYGTPWSGKTPCYRRVRVPVRAMVFLVQAPRNSIYRPDGAQSFAKMLSSVSSIHWNSVMEENIADTVSEVLCAVPLWCLECLPDADAALTCMKAIEQ